MTRFHTTVTERGQFRDCRRRWYLESVENLAPATSAAWNLWFGNAAHEALDAYYRRNRVASYLLDAFQHAWRKQDDELCRTYGAFYAHGIQEEWRRHRDMGEALLREYVQFDHADAFFDNVVDVAVEERSFVTIQNPDPVAEKLPWPLLSGRIDLVIEKPSGLWIVDHKTYAQKPSMPALELDDQLTGYCYIYWRLTGEVPAGAMYNVLIKNPPVPPPRLNSGRFSQDKRLRTTYAIYRDTVRVQDPERFAEGHYNEYLDMLSRKGWDGFFLRVGESRSLTELKSFERRLWREYKHMSRALEDPEERYPNPQNRLCGHCSVRSLCHAMEAGDDVEYLKNHAYVRNEPRVTIPEGV
jgi:RecB family exonuclease